MRIYNSEFEISARLLVLMSVWKNLNMQTPLLPQILLGIYAHSFSVAETNLNGYNDFLYSEFSNLRAIGIKALKGLSLLGFVEPHYSAKGIEYLISEKGLEYTSKLDSSYYRKYSNIAQKLKIS